MKWPGKVLFGALACAMTATLAASCGGGDDGTTAAASGSAASTGGMGGGPAAIACEGAPPDLSLEGTWVAYGRLSVKLVGAPGGAITVCPEDQIGESTLLLLLTVKQDPADKTKITEATATLCSIELPIVTALVGACDPSSESLVSTQIIAPAELNQALPKLSAKSVTGSLAGTSAGAAVDLDRFTVTAGSTKSGAALPKWNADDAACGAVALGHTTCETMCVDDCGAMSDDDGDARPGVTVHVCGVTPDDIKKGVACNAYEPNEPGVTLQGRAYLNLEVDPKFNGTAVSSCEVTGTVDTNVLYNVVGADMFLTGGPISVTSAIKSLPAFTVDPQASKFRMVRIDGEYGAPDWKVDPSNGSEACAVLVSRVNEL